MYRKNLIICFLTCTLFGQAYCGDFYAGFTLFGEKAEKYIPNFQTFSIDRKTQEVFNFYSLENWPTVREMTAQFYRKHPEDRYTNLLLTVIAALQEMQRVTFPPQIKELMVFIMTDGIENFLKGAEYTKALADLEKEIAKSASNKTKITVYVVEARPRYSDGPRPGLDVLKCLSENNPARHFKLPDFKDSNSTLNKLLDQVNETNGKYACYFMIDRSSSLRGADGDLEYAINVIRDKILAKEENNAAEFAIIPAGKYIKGSNDHDDDEIPAHERVIETFRLGIYPVTEAQYYAVMGTPEKAQKFKDSKKPVTGVSWFNAITYCNKRSEMEGKRPAYRVMDNGTVICVPGSNGYYLPSETQLQYAARAGTTNLFLTGQTLINEEINLSGELTEVGFYKPNPWGLFDLIGSIRQWTEDFYGEYRPDNNFNPPVNGSTRVVYGASYRDKDKPDRYRITYRFHHDPEFSDEYLGFRIAVSE